MSGRRATAYKALLIDMDGVLVDSEPLHMKAWAEVLSPLGLEVDRAWFDPWIGVPDAELAAHVCRELVPEEQADALLNRKRSAYARIRDAELTVMPGVDDALADFKDLPMAVVTSSRRAEAEASLAKTGLAPYFAALVAADDVPRTKPAPDPYRRAAALLAVDPAGCVVIEDSPAGIASAQAAGCTAYAVSTTCGSDQLHQADRIFPSTAEALECVRGIVVPLSST